MQRKLGFAAGSRWIWRRWICKLARGKIERRICKVVKVLGRGVKRRIGCWLLRADVASGLLPVGLNGEVAGLIMREGNWTLNHRGGGTRSVRRPRGVVW